jgi:FtsZ-binding cell division protein ZapB
MYQLDLFEKDTIKLIMQEIDKIRERSENVQRGVYARVAELKKEVDRLRKEKNARQG